MATTDISRAAFDTRKRYTSVRMQQGRIIVDDDWNENERIENEDRRRGRADVIGPAGSPDAGFRIANALLDSNAQIDFDIEPGTFYVGGLRLELEERQTYRLQTDWLQGPDEVNDAPTAERVDLVYLEAYQQTVSAIEDSELFEVALGGPDTSTRVRTMQRVHVLKSIKPDCCIAWGELIGQLAGSFTEENELVPDVELKVDYTSGSASTDLCTPDVASGYLGAENQAIRVQLVSTNKLTWGFDNASPLYRVQDIDGKGETLELITDPKDEAHWPLAGQIVEILPWAAVLPNSEKVAGIQGHLSRVLTAYDPDEGTIILETPIPSTAGLDSWKTRSDADTLKTPRDSETPGEYYFMRVWDRGADTTSDPAISFTAGTAVTLGKTGVQVTITGNNQKEGDYWIIAVRPETPDEVVPWELEEGRQPHGVRRFYAPLALIDWKFKNGTLDKAEMRDCRPRFRPLTRQKACCTCTVGDGKVSFGDFDSLEDAVAHVPAAGGQICLLPGRHRANVVINDGKNIRITGCGERTRVEPRDEKLAQPIFQVIDSQSITLERMDLVTVGGTAIVLEGTEPDSLREVEIGHNRMLALEEGVRVKQGLRINIHHNRINILDKEDAGAGVYMLADDSLIERNEIVVVPAEATPEEPPEPEDAIDPRDPCEDVASFHGQTWYLLDFYLGFLWGYVFDITPTNPFKAPGGVQIAGGSERVRVVENQIRGGAGNGVTLGSRLDLNALADSSSEEETLEEYVVRSESGGIRGVTYDTSGKALKEVTLSFQNTSDDTLFYSTVTDDEGYFQVRSKAGDYRVSALGYKVEGVDHSGDRNFITLSEAEKPSVDIWSILASLYEIQIEGNVISDMGLSGIGVPHVTWEELGLLVSLAPSLQALCALLLVTTGTLAGFAVNAQIWGNRILRCLQNAFDAEMEVLVQVRGMGGISLGLCRNLVVRENRVEDNGTNHLDPVCGIFVSYADQVDVGHNQIVNNGPAVSLSTDFEKGIRGGVVLRATSYPIVNPTTGGGEDSGSASAVSSFFSLLKGRQAARVHDNTVEQPVGRALALTALGPVSVVNNQFNTDIPSGSTFAGAVEVTNLGCSLSVQFDWESARGPQYSTGLFSGNTLFNNNQTCLTLAGGSLFSQLIITMDDLGFDGNQSDVLGEVQVLACNTLLFGATLRASDSRFKEPMGTAAQDALKSSLLALGGYLNNTTDNQGNHCIVAASLDSTRLVERDNQALMAKAADDCSLQRQLGATLLALLVLWMVQGKAG